MRKKRLLILVFAALLSGLGAAYVSVGYLGSERPRPAAPVRSATRMAVAVRDLPLGAVVQAEDVKLVEWHAGGALPEGYLASVEEAAGRALIRAVAMHEPFLRSKFADQDARGLPIMIPDGMRGMSVKVDEVVGVAGYVLPEMRVDVLVTVSPPDNSREKLTRVILQNIRVLAAGQTMEQNAEGKPVSVTVITLLVTPQQAEVLALAANEGRIQLALRGVLDLEEVTTPGARVASLISGGQAAPPRRVDLARPRARPATEAADRGAVVEMFKGGVRTLTIFND
jgi:pilus assembly protein CpaB